METVMRINGIVNGIVWGPPMLALLVGTGIYLSFVLGFPQVRYFAFMFKEVFGQLGKKTEGEGTITAFGALATALASTLGSGNIAGAATALHLGGPGALFWMWITAIFGMATKMTEVSLAVKFREKDAQGNWRGGTMYVMEKALGQKWLAWLFAFFATFAAFGIGNAIQANSTAEALNLGYGVPHWISGIVMAILVGLVIIGGLKRIADVTTYLIPFMSVFYVVGGLVVIFFHVDLVPQAIYRAVYYAFNDPMAMPGAVAGWSIKMALQYGVARGVFSNEAGLGSAPMVHATAITDHPAKQGCYGLFEVFMDTIVVCSITCIGILTTGTLFDYPELTGARLTMTAFSTILGTPGVMILAAGLAMFAFSTILGWYWYGETGATYIFGVKIAPVYKVLWLTVVVVGAWGGGGDFLAHIWDLSDTMNGLMAAPNLVALLWLSNEMRKIVKDFDEKRAKGKVKPTEAS